MKRLISAAILASLVATGCGADGLKSEAPRDAGVSQTESQKSIEVEAVEAYPNLEFDQPLYYTHSNDQSNLAYVVERTGRVKCFANDENESSAETFLDLSGKIDNGGQEKGLLGLAFHPDYEDNGYFYVNYTDEEGTVISRYRVSPDDPKAADPDSEVVLMSFDQPYSNHNGGCMEFGPDGYLYIATGDGGSAGDPQGNAQNLSSFLGKILRIDVDNPVGPREYGIPSDNPFAGNKEGYLEEIYAFGFRNPWRFSFDMKTGKLWAADVGQSRTEELDIVESGKNYGWNIKEGTEEYSSGDSNTELQDPVWQYDHGTGRSITGGYVYHGGAVKGLDSAYVYGDFVEGKVWALWMGQNSQVDNVQILDTDMRISSFGMDRKGELYIVDFRGKIYRIQAK